jgi:hypothetical protein
MISKKKSIGSAVKYPQKGQFLHMYTCNSVITLPTIKTLPGTEENVRFSELNVFEGT